MTRRVLILGTAPFLAVVVEAATARWPGCAIRIVYPPGDEFDVRTAGLEPEPALAFAGPRLGEPGPVGRSRHASRSVRRRRSSTRAGSARELRPSWRSVPGSIAYPKVLGNDGEGRWFGGRH